MAEQVTTPRMEDLVSVGSRISWGAIAAGAVVALALQFLLAVLGGAVGLSISDRVDPTDLRTGAVVWAIVTVCAALFVGGMVTSQFTVGENKMEALLYGIIMWALLFALLLGLGAAGGRVGWNAMVRMADLAHTASAQSWETAARNAGVRADQIDEWRRKMAGSADKKDGSAPTPEATSDAVTRITWYTFAGTWLSMLAAALGALVGAGPTFKLAATRETVAMRIG
jgi:hypothetical protein